MELGALLVDERFLPAAITLIAAAKKSVYISTFKAEMSSKPRGRKLMTLFDSIIEKARLGLDVRFLLNKISNRKGVPRTNLYAINQLPKHGVQVRHLRRERVCHAKIIIIDDFFAILGSHNLSIPSCDSNFEVSYMIRDDYTVKYLSDLFKHIWENAKKA